jgi:hypothetical protein
MYPNYTNNICYVITGTRLMSSLALHYDFRDLIYKFFSDIVLFLALYLSIVAG